MKNFSGLFVASLALALSQLGCQSPPAEPRYVEDTATPALAQGQPLSDFVLGTWAFQDMSTGGEFDQRYEFKADGTFALVKDKHKIGGTWEAQPNGIILKHETIDGKTMQQATEEIRKQEEIGTQGGVAAGVFHDWLMNDIGTRNFAQLDETGTGFFFTTGAATPDPNDMGGMMMGMKGSLIRVKQESE
ncbi:MAG: hypothetical protein KF812_08470 [Fimbriimonadaceae bacterium]|nr:hypothetical protein [Fimbriimonadaceae bacterium]